MAAQFDNGFALYPAAFGALVLSKAYAVLRGACLPRVLPPGMTLVSANARLSMFGLGAAAVGGGLLAGLISVTDSYPLALRLTAVVCLVAAVLSLRLPAAVDSAEGEVEATVVRSGQRGRIWQGQSLGAHVVTALRAAGALRALSGFLTLFLAFYIQSTETGTAAAVALGGLVAAAAGGSVAGTALGARMTLSRPDPVLLASIGGVARGRAGRRAVVQPEHGDPGRRRGRRGQRAGQALPGRDHPAGGRRTRCGRPRSPGPRRCCSSPGWPAAGSGIALPPNGPLGFGVAAGLLVLSFAATVVGRRRSLRPRVPAAGRPGAAAGAGDRRLAR